MVPMFMYFQLLKPTSLHCHGLHWGLSAKLKLHSHLPDSDLKHIVAEHWIIPPKHRWCYTVKRFRRLPHGSDYIVDRHLIRAKLKRYGIPLTINPEPTEEWYVNDEFGITICYNTHSPLRENQVLLNSVETGLLNHILSSTTTTNTDARREGDNHHLQERIRWGWGRGQPSRSSAYQEHDGTSIPSLNLREYQEIPPELRSGLFQIFAGAHEILTTRHPGAFGDDERNRIFGGRLRREMGCDDPKRVFYFEYYDIVVTSKSNLRRHMDYLNDKRNGYDFVAVYSFFRAIDGIEYKASIIMTSRSSAGAAAERCREGLDGTAEGTTDGTTDEGSSDGADNAGRCSMM